MVYLKNKFNKRLIFLILSLIFFFTELSGTILYEKNNIIITEFDVNLYKNYYENLHSLSISQSKAIKDLIMIRKILSKLEKNNPKAIDELDQEIKNQLGSIIFNNKDLLDFNRYIIIKNQFINEYFQNSLTLNDLKIITDKIKTLKVNLSDNQCMTIIKNVAISEIQSFEEILFKKIKLNNNNIIILFDKKNYEICFNKNLDLSIEKELINYLEKKTQAELEKFIYEK